MGRDLTSKAPEANTRQRGESTGYAGEYQGSSGLNSQPLTGFLDASGMKGRLSDSSLVPRIVLMILEPFFFFCAHVPGIDIFNTPGATNVMEPR